MVRTLVGVALAAVFSAPAPAAAAVQTYVSGKGTDTGACTLPAPCRTFAYALGQTTTAGEIVALDSADYGTIEIQKSVSVSAPQGVEASIAVPGNGIGVKIGATFEKLHVNLRGLTIDGHNLGVNGVEVLGGSVEIADCVIRNLKNTGVFQSGATTAIVSTTISRSPYAIMYRSTINDARQTNIVSSSLIENTPNGIVVYEGTVSILDTVFKDNAPGTDLTTTDGSAYISRSNINSVMAGGSGFTGKVFTYGNNTIKGPVTGSLTPVPLQ